jgi:hypothetical protein
MPALLAGAPMIPNFGGRYHGEEIQGAEADPPNGRIWLIWRTHGLNQAVLSFLS